jgi:hypothetical protein
MYMVLDKEKPVPGSTSGLNVEVRPATVQMIKYSFRVTK